MNRLSSVPIVVVLLLVSTHGHAWSQATYYDRNEIPGNYTLGFYADAAGISRSIQLEADQHSFECYLGVTGDSTQVFSGLTFSVELPEEAEMEGALAWQPIPDLEQWGSLTDGGVEVEFNNPCMKQDGEQPLMLARLRVRVTERFEGGSVVVAGHRRWGIGVELCDPERTWPKPFAEGLALTVERKQSFWSKVQKIFKK